MRRFVVIGQKATASPDFSLVDIAGTSGRLDVLLRCLRAALLVSHGLRGDTMAYLVLLGGERAPRVVRFDGAIAAYVRPDERSLAVTLQKALGTPTDDPPGVGAPHVGATRFVTVRRGIAIAAGGLDVVIADMPGATPYILEEGAPDLRDAPIELGAPAFFIGDHLGFDDATRARLALLGAKSIGVGPVSVHADDAITVVHNEIDRREARR